MVLKVDRISAQYTPGEEVVRFASMNGKIHMKMKFSYAQGYNQVV
jgi:hypothetical protein